MLSGPISFLHSTRVITYKKLRRHGDTDVAVSLGADALLPLVEVGSPWPVAAAVLKYGWRRDLSSKLCGPVSSSERRWCCSHSHTSTCSLVAWLFWGLKNLWWKKLKKKKRHKLQAAATSWSLLNPLSCPHSLFCNVFHMVLIHRYSVADTRLVLSTVNIIQTPTLTLIQSEGTWVGKYSLSVHFPGDCFPLTPLPMLYFYLWTAHASCCSSPFLAKFTPIHKTPAYDVANNTEDAMSATTPPLSPIISIRFFPLPPLPSAAVQWGCYPRQRCCHHCTPPPPPPPAPAPAVNHSDWAPPTCR